MSQKESPKKAGRPKKKETVKLSPWTILIPWETRNAVTKAADRQKMGLNEWINKALHEAAKETLTGKREVAKPEDVMDVVKQMAERLDKLAQDINKPWWKRKK